MSMVLSGMSKLESYEVVVVSAVQEKPSAVHIVPEPNGPAFSAQINFKDCASQCILRCNLLICFIKKQIYKNCPGKCPKRKGIIPGVTGLRWTRIVPGEREGKGKGHKYCAHRRNRQLAVSHGYPLAHVSTRRKRKRRRPGGDLFSWPLAGQQCPEQVGCARTR